MAARKNAKEMPALVTKNNEEGGVLSPMLAGWLGDPGGLFLRWPVPTSSGPEMLHFLWSCTINIGMGQCHGSVCCNVSPQTQKQAMVHQSALSPGWTWPLWKHLWRMSGLEKKDLLHAKATLAQVLIDAGSIKTPRRGKPSATPLPLNNRAVSRPRPLTSALVLETPSPSSLKQKKKKEKNAVRCHDTV